MKKVGCRRKKLFCKSIIFALKNTGSCCVCNGEGRVRRGGGRRIRGEDRMGDTGNAVKASGRERHALAIMVKGVEGCK